MRILAASIAVGMVFFAQGARAQDAKAMFDAMTLEDVVVRRGNTLSGITGKYLWPLVYGLNKTTVKNPNLIYPRQIIKVPKIDEEGMKVRSNLLPEVGVVLHATPGEVVFVSVDGSMKPLAAGDELDDIGGVQVGSGTALLRMADGTVMRIFDRSKVMLNGVLLDRRRDASYRYVGLTQGRIRIELAEPMPERDRFEVETPVAIVEAKGQDFQVEVEPGVATRISAFKGETRVIGRARFIDLQAGDGAYIPGDGTKLAKVALPSSPRVVKPTGATGERVTFEWTAQADARGYLLQVATDLQMTELKFIGTVYDSATFEIDLYNSGDYYWTIESINELGFTSVPATPSRFRVDKGVAAR